MATKHSHRQKIVCLSTVILLLSATTGASVISHGQMGKLLDAVWKEKPQRMAVTVYEHTWRPKQSEEALRQQHEQSIRQIKGLPEPEKMSPAEYEHFQREVQWNLEISLHTQNEGQRTKSRIQIDGDRQRIDTLIIEPEMVMFAGTPHETLRAGTTLTEDTPYTATSINTPDKNWRIIHRSKTAQVFNRLSPPPEHPVVQFAAVLSVLQPFLGTYEGPPVSSYMPDIEKIQRAEKTGIVSDGVTLAILPDANEPENKIRIELASELLKHLVVVTDGMEFSNVYELKLYNPQAGTLLLNQIFSDYGSDGYPRRVVSTEYDMAGVFRKKTLYEFEKVDLAAEIDPTIFVAPKEYVVYDQENPEQFHKHSQDKVAQQKIAQEIFNTQDPAQIKTLLTHPEWEIRIQSLRMLQFLLKNAPDQLVEIAEDLKDDPNLHIRKVASDILTQKQK